MTTAIRLRSNSGIYIIVSPSGKVYVGQSTNLKKRKYEHFRQLRKGTHVNRYLQNAYDKYDGNLFLVVIEYVEDLTLLTEREQYWMDAFDSYEKGYNLTIAAESALGTTKSEETRKLLSEITKENWKDAGFKAKVMAGRQSHLDKPETRLLMAENTRKFFRNNPDTAKLHSERMKVKSSGYEYREKFLSRMANWRNSKTKEELSEIAKEIARKRSKESFEITKLKSIITRADTFPADNGVLWIMAKSRNGTTVLTAMSRWTELDGRVRTKMFSTKKYGLLPAWALAVSRRVKENKRLCSECVIRLEELYNLT